jgi:tetratricopeptide (TPR) repeat protein
MLRRSQDALNDNNMAMKYATTDSLRNFALANRASDKVMLKDFNGAIADYQEFIRKDPEHQYNVYPDIASALFQAGRTDEAIEYNMKAYRHDSTNTKPIVNLAYQFGKKGEYDKSVFYSDKALKLEPKNPYALNNKGYAELMLGKLNNALNDINASIALDPSNAYAYKNRALVYLKQKLKNQACADLKTAKQLGYTQVYDNEVDNLIAKNCAAPKAPQKGRAPVHKKK